MPLTKYEKNALIIQNKGQSYAQRFKVVIHARPFFIVIQLQLKKTFSNAYHLRGNSPDLHLEREYIHLASLSITGRSDYSEFSIKSDG